MDDFNPYLTPGNAQRGEVEKRINIPWQTRPSVPSEFENRLGDALEQAFTAGAATLAEMIKTLNAQQVFDAQGEPWTEASFEAAMGKYA